MNSFWRHCLAHFEQELPPQQFVTWIKPLKCETEGDALVLVAPNSRFLHTLEESYRPTVDRALSGLPGPTFEVHFSLEEEDGHEPIAEL